MIFPLIGFISLTCATVSFSVSFSCSVSGWLCSLLSFDGISVMTGPVVMTAPSVIIGPSGGARGGSRGSASIECKLCAPWLVYEFNRAGCNKSGGKSPYCLEPFLVSLSNAQCLEWVACLQQIVGSNPKKVNDSDRKGVRPFFGSKQSLPINSERTSWSHSRE